jgi:hypothetical protein
MRFRTRDILAAVAVAPLMVLTSCGNASVERKNETQVGHQQSVKLEVPGRYSLPRVREALLYFAGQNAVYAAASSNYFATTLSDNLPNQTYSVEGAPPTPSSGGVVVGRVLEATPAYGFVSSGGETRDDPQTSTPVGFDNPRAEWRIATVRISVQKSAGIEGPPGEVVVGALVTAVGEDAHRQVQGLSELGDVVVILDGERSYAWDPKVRVVARGGALLGDVDPAGFIGFPALGPENKVFVGQLDTVPELMSDAARTKPMIKLVMDPTTQRLVPETVD